MLGLSLHSVSQNRYHMDETLIRDNSELLLILKSTNEPLTGVVYDEYENGQLMKETVFQYGLENGLKKNGTRMGS